jgi:alkaline phosphatase
MKRTFHVKPLVRLMVFLALALAALSSCAAAGFPAPTAGPKYIFLFIGDGMGENHVAAARLYAATSEAAAKGIAPLRFPDFPVRGEIATHNISLGVTDSAAAATALASGRKTANGVLNMNPWATERYAIITDLAKARGRRVGIVTSVSLDHATPAGFYAFSGARGDYYSIAVQLAARDFDYFGGGGFLSPRGANGDRTDVLALAAGNGFTVALTKAAFAALAPGVGKVIAVGEKLDGSEALPYAADRSPGDPALADFVAKGIELLDGDGGFFIMAEGGKIDWASHANDVFRAMPEVADLDEAVAAAIAFQSTHPDETLIVVTSDHETGGLEIAEGDGFDWTRLSWSKSGHTGAKVAVFASGIGQELFAGSYDNTGIFERLKALIEAE